MESSLAKFEKVKKYDENFPAFYNQRLLELKTKPENACKLYIQIYLDDTEGNISELQAKLGIKVTRHPKLKLIIFNYDHLTTPHDSLIGLECRGLVLEETTWRVVAKPMNRFFNWGEINLKYAPHPNFESSQFDFQNFVTQSKCFFVA